MVTFRRGLDAEDRVRTQLRALGCELQTNERLDHTHKLDFVVIQFPGNPAFLSLGVQVTARTDDGEKMHEFWMANKESRVTQKSIYVELDNGLDLENGGAMTLFFALASFTFCRGNSAKIAGVKVFNDMTYEFFAIEDRIRHLRAGQAQVILNSPTRPIQTSPFREVALASVPNSALNRPTPVTPVVPVGIAVAKINSALKGTEPPVIRGWVNGYFRERGYGYISGEDGNKYFFHFTSITDQSLKDRLNALPYSERAQALEDVPLTFRPKGKRAEHDSYEQAGEIQIAQAMASATA